MSLNTPARDFSGNNPDLISLAGDAAAPDLPVLNQPQHKVVPILAQRFLPTSQPFCNNSERGPVAQLDRASVS